MKDNAPYRIAASRGGHCKETGPNGVDSKTGPEKESSLCNKNCALYGRALQTVGDYNELSGKSRIF